MAEPFATHLSELLKSFKETGGIERLMDFIFLGAGSSNGYDALGHFLRAEPVAANCIAYKVKPETGCSANFVKEEKEEEGAKSASAHGASARAASTVMARTLAVLEGKTAAQAIAEYPGSEGSTGAGAGSARPAGGDSSHTTYYTPGAEAPGASERLLEYLLGS